VVGEVVVETESLSHEEWLLLEYAIVIEHEIIYQVHNLLLESQGVALSCFGCDLVLQEFHTTILLDKLSLSIEVVCLEEGRQTAKDGLFYLGVLFYLELVGEIDGSTFGCELLHIGIVGDDRSQNGASTSANLLAAVGEDETKNLLHAPHETNI